MVSVPILVIKCAVCGNKHPYYKGKCPVADMDQRQKSSQNLPKVFFGPSPSIFVGHKGYPNVFVGPLADMTLGGSKAVDTPSKWHGLTYRKIIEMRGSLMRSKQPENVFSRSRFVDDMQLLSLAEKPTDVELAFKKKPTYSIKFSSVLQPMGPTATLQKMQITENVKILKPVEKIIGDELKADDASFALYKEGEDIYKIMTILSSGIFGLKQNKKRLVPTRWSITAVDDLIFKKLADEVRQFPSINEFRVYESTFLDNKFIVLLMPGKWEYEGFEAWAPGSNWAQSLQEMNVIPEYEGHEGRTSYAEGQAGGYYAARLGVIEAMHRMKRQARVVVFREVYEGYVIPVGVFLIRETVRNALSGKHTEFSTLKEALDFIQPKLRLKIQQYAEKSKLLAQRRLGDFRP